MRYVIIHDADHDGYASAWLMVRHLNPEGVHITAETLTYPIRAGNNEVPELMEGDHVYILDRSYPVDVLLTMSAKVAHVMVIDHHKTFMETVSTTFRNSGGIYREDFHNGEAVRIECGSENLEILVDTRHAACLLTLAFCDTRSDRYRNMIALSETYDDLWFIKYIGDRDTWKFDLPMSKEINAGIHSFNLSFDDLTKMYNGDITIEQCEERGIGILTYQQMLMASMLSVSHSETESVYNKIVWSDGVVVAQCPFTPLISDFGNFLLEETKAVVAVLWFMIPNSDRLSPQMYHYSVRSKVDTSKIAAALGGGGHALANGFRTHIPPTHIAKEFDNAAQV